jgi:hypothetical protein
VGAGDHGIFPVYRANYARCAESQEIVELMEARLPLPLDECVRAGSVGDYYRLGNRTDIKR